MTVALMKPLIILGATASGKEAAALALAPQINAEIIVVDSMKIYRTLDIGTAKPTPAMREVVVHHCLDLIAPTENFSVADFLAAAQTARANIRAAGKNIIFVGGTALYYKALIDGLCKAPPANLALREELKNFAAAQGNAALYERLQQLDAAAAAKLHPHDTRRVVRALEVALTTDAPLSERQTQWAGFHAHQPAIDNKPLVNSAPEFTICLLSLERELLRARIAARVERMIATGLVDEAARVYAARAQLGRTPLQAVAYKEFFPYFAGEMSLANAVELLKIRTCQLAKSQMTWFRKFPAQVINVAATTTTAEIVAQLLQFIAPSS